MADSGGTVLVTGGTGFLGGWCIAALLERGHDVRTTVRDLAREQAVRDAVAAAGVDAGDRLTVLAADLTSDAGLGARRSPAAATCCTSPRRSRPCSPRTPTS